MHFRTPGKSLYGAFAAVLLAAERSFQEDFAQASAKGQLPSPELSAVAEKTEHRKLSGARDYQRNRIGKLPARRVFKPGRMGR